MSIAIPSAPAELTPAWCTVALQAAGVLNGAVVTRVDVEDIGEGFGFTGVVVRVRLIYSPDAQNLPEAMVVKLPLARQAMPSSYRQEVDRDPVAALAHFERAAREIRFYRDFHTSAAAPFPCFYYGAADQEQGVVLVLEDITPARHVDALAGGTADDAWAVLEPLARWHALWWEDLRLSELAWLPRWGGDPDARQLRYRERVDAFLTLHQHRTPDDIVELVLVLREQYAAVIRELAVAPATAIHGDMHLDNVLYHEPRAGQRATIIDWQGVSRGSCALDAMLFLVDALPVEVRREEGDELLQRYFNALVEHGIADYTRERFLRDGRLALLQRFSGTVTWLARAEPDTLEGRERAIVDDIFERGQLFTAIRDYAAGDALPS